MKRKKLKWQLKGKPKYNPLIVSLSPPFPTLALGIVAFKLRQLSLSLFPIQTKRGFSKSNFHANYWSKHWLVHHHHHHHDHGDDNHHHHDDQHDHFVSPLHRQVQLVQEPGCSHRWLVPVGLSEVRIWPLWRFRIKGCLNNLFVFFCCIFFVASLQLPIKPVMWGFLFSQGLFAQK